MKKRGNFTKNARVIEKQKNDFVVENRLQNLSVSQLKLTKGKTKLHSCSVVNYNNNICSGFNNLFSGTKNCIKMVKIFG